MRGRGLAVVGMVSWATGAMVSGAAGAGRAGAVVATRPAGVSATQPAAGPLTARVDRWPMFRGGPTMPGVAPGRLPERLELAWTFPTDEPIVSSAVIDRGRVFIGSGDGNVYGLRLSDGKKLWSYATKDVVEAPPLVVDGVVVIGSLDGVLYCLDAERGTLRWKYATEDRIAGSANAMLSPAGRLDRILVGSYDYLLHCVDGDGRKLWTYETE